MSNLPAHLRELEGDLAVAAATRVDQLARRRRRSIVLVTIVAGLGLAGAGLAASGAIQSWLGAAGRGEARFLVDSGSTYEGPAPAALACADVSGERFACNAGSTGPRVYDLLFRVEAQPRVTRESALARIESAASTGELDGAVATQIEADLRAVPDDFFDRLAVFTAFSSVAVSSGVDRGDGPMDVVPPPGVPQLAACQKDGSGDFACRPLAGATGVAVGTPIYVLRQSDDWVEQPAQQVEGNPEDLHAMVEAIWGRPLEPAELRLLHLAVTPVTAGATVSTEASTVPQP